MSPTIEILTCPEDYTPVSYDDVTCAPRCPRCRGVLHAIMLADGRPVVACECEPDDWTSCCD